jgi:hypothetical protein
VLTSALTAAALGFVFISVIYGVFGDTAGQRIAAIKNTAAKPGGVCEIGPEAITAFFVEASAASAAAVTANAFSADERIIWMTAVKSSYTLKSM